MKLNVNMKNFKQIFIVLTITILLSTLNSSVLAQSAAQNAANELCQGNDCPITDSNGIYKILETIASYIYKIFFAVAVIIILLAAFTFLTAGDDPNKITSARKQLLWAAVAVGIALLSFSANAIIKSVLSGGTNSSNYSGYPI